MTVRPDRRPVSVAMSAVTAGVLRAVPRVPKRASASSLRAPRALPIARAARDNPNFDPNDPMTWGPQREGGSGDGEFLDFGVPGESLMQLSDEQLGQLLGASGATAPVMLDDAELALAFANAGAAAADDTSDENLELAPETAAEAIDVGLRFYKSGEYEAALGAFKLALDLKGTGPIRARKAKVAPAGPSLGYADASVSLNEQIAIHYNCACCYARLDDTQSGLVSLVRAMEAGYDDYDNIKTDADIQPLRDDARFAGILAKFEPQGVLGGVFAALSKGTTQTQAKSGGAPRGGGGGELIAGLFNAVKQQMKK